MIPGYHSLSCRPGLFIDRPLYPASVIDAAHLHADDSSSNFTMPAFIDPGASVDHLQVPQLQGMDQNPDCEVINRDRRSFARTVLLQEGPSPDGAGGILGP